jgi:serine/threonine protein kinase
MLLGEGAYGKVSKIKVNQKYFALKETILPEYPKEPEVIMACLREEAMNLVHPHIIERKSSVFLNNTFQLRMELGVPVYEADERRILHDIGQALWFMHSKGFIHRDVKPANIVRVGKEYKLVDFGLTRKSECKRTLTGYMVSRWFRPPELLRAENDLRYDGRVDMYSLALAAHFLHHQKPLFHGTTAQLLKQYRRHKPQGLYKHLVCEYEDRFTAKQFLAHCRVTPIEGSEGELPYREGDVAMFTKMMIGGYDATALQYGHKDIYKEL